MRHVERERQPAWRLLTGVTGQRGQNQRRPTGEQRGRECEELDDRALLPFRPVEVEGDESGEAEERQHELEIQEVAAETGRPCGRDDRSEVERRAQRELRRCQHDVDGNRHDCDAERDSEGHRERPQRAARDDPHHRTGDHGSQHEQAEGAQQRQEHHPARDEQPRRRRGLAQRGHAELRRRPGVRPDREGEGAAHRVPVRRDHAPEDEVPALRHALERREQRLRRPRRAPRRARRHLVAARVGDRDDREARLDRLGEAQQHPRRRRVHGPARRGLGPYEPRMAPGGRGQREGRRGRQSEQGTPPHATGRPLVASPTIPSRTPIPPTISATMVSVELEPPKEETPSITGAGVSELSEPVQSTTSPFE